MPQHDKLNVVAIMRSEANGTHLNEVCGGMNGTRLDVHVGRLQDVCPGVPILDASDALLLDVDPRNSEDVSNLRDIVTHRFPHKPVIVTAVDASVHDVRIYLHLGAADVLPQPIQQSEFLSALEFSMGRKNKRGLPARSRGKIVSILKSGGGAGATTLAVQMGCLLGSNLRDGGKGPCLLDFDIQSGTAALYLDLPDRNGLSDLIESPERFDASLLNAVMCRHNSGLSVLASPREIVEVDSVGIEFVHACLQTTADEFQHVVVDLPTVWTPWVVEALSQSDLILLVTQQSVPHIRQARGQLNALEAYGLGGDHIKLICNRFESGWSKSVRLKGIEKALGRKVDHCIGNDFKLVSEAIDQGVPLSQIKRRSRIEKDINKIINAIAAPADEAAERREPHLELRLAS